MATKDDGSGGLLAVLGIGAGIAAVVSAENKATAAEQRVVMVADELAKRTLQLRDERAAKEAAQLEARDANAREREALTSLGQQLAATTSERDRLGAIVQQHAQVIATVQDELGLERTARTSAETTRATVEGERNQLAAQVAELTERLRVAEERAAKAGSAA